MKTKSGFETDGKYIKYKSGFTSFWKVETENSVDRFNSELEADEYIKDFLNSNDINTK